jgi:hypothetical protein
VVGSWSLRKNEPPYGPVARNTRYSWVCARMLAIAVVAVWAQPLPQILMTLPLGSLSARSTMSVCLAVFE